MAVRVSLRDDIIGGRRWDEAGEPAGSGVPAWLDDDLDSTLSDTASTVVTIPIADVELAEGWRLLTVRDRVSNGYDPDGNPEWTWVVMADGVAAFIGETRTEVDDRAGLTHVVADAVLPYPIADGTVRETAVVTDDLGGRWIVTRVARYPDRLELKLERIDDAA